MRPSVQTFPANAEDALADMSLQTALGKMKAGFSDRRRRALERLPEFESLRDQAKAIKDHTLDHLDYYLEAYEAKVLESGGKIHWCRNADEARTAILQICQNVKAATVTKGKSMIGEEIAINDYLAHHGIEPVETDLGEYIIQLRKETPSHIIAPAVHVNKEQVAEAFRIAHAELDPERILSDSKVLLGEARQMLRHRFLSADVGITGANFLVAETGSSIIVTNEGNGDLTQTLPKVHIVLASLEKLVPTLEDATTLLRVLARSATGQETAVYTSLSTGPRRSGDPDGPEAYHVVLLDNGRSALLGGDFQDILRCIRCGSCLNHCPVYGSVGGHAYGAVYSGPMGAVLTPGLIGIEAAGHLPNASTFCGRCEAVCPMRIPLPKMMRHWREQEYQAGGSSPMARRALQGWAIVARRPWLYRRLNAVIARVLGWLSRRTGRFTRLPFAAGWTDHRDMPAPQGRTFQALWSRYGVAQATDALALLRRHGDRS